MDRSINRIKNTFLNYWGIWIVAGVFFIFLIIKILIPAVQKIEEKETVPTPVFGEAEYVGSERCKDCHWREYDAWKVTLHSKFMQRPEEKTVIGDFETNNKLTVKVTSGASRLANTDAANTMFKKNGKFYVNTGGPDWGFYDYEVSYVIGIGRRQNYLTKFPDGELHVLPVEWDAKRRIWIDLNGLKNNYPGDAEYWSDPGSIWQLRCGGCHATGLKVNYDKENDSFDSTWANMGIGCEACHGPGSNHVKAASEYFDYEKDTIVNPAKLPWRLRAMVCGQCHNWGASTKEVSPYKKGFPRRYSYPNSYLPGEALYLSYIEEQDERRKHHQQYNEWLESQHAKAGIMCTACHSVHDVREEATGISPTKLTADNLCMDCHKTLQRRAAHRIHTFGSCVACHMPETKGHEHSHTFQFISPAESIKAGGVDKQPNSCSGCHHHKDTPLANLVEFLEAAKKADMPIPFTVHGK